MTVNKDSVVISKESKKELELFLANSNLDESQRKTLNDILLKYYNDGYQYGRIEVVMNRNKGIK